jgi:hypothetical protein
MSRHPLARPSLAVFVVMVLIGALWFVRKQRSSAVAVDTSEADTTPETTLESGNHDITSKNQNAPIPKLVQLNPDEVPAQVWAAAQKNVVAIPELKESEFADADISKAKLVGPWRGHELDRGAFALATSVSRLSEFVAASDSYFFGVELKGKIAFLIKVKGKQDQGFPRVSLGWMKEAAIINEVVSTLAPSKETFRIIYQPTLGATLGLLTRGDQESVVPLTPVHWLPNQPEPGEVLPAASVIPALRTAINKFDREEKEREAANSAPQSPDPQPYQ